MKFSEAWEACLQYKKIRIGTWVRGTHYAIVGSNLCLCRGDGSKVVSLDTVPSCEMFSDAWEIMKSEEELLEEKAFAMFKTWWTAGVSKSGGAYDTAEDAWVGYPAYYNIGFIALAKEYSK